MFLKDYSCYIISNLSYTPNRFCTASIFAVDFLLLGFSPGFMLLIKPLFLKLQMFSLNQFFFFFQSCIWFFLHLKLFKL